MPATYTARPGALRLGHALPGLGGATPPPPPPPPPALTDALPSLPPFAFGQQNDVRTEMLLGGLGWTNITQWVEEISTQNTSRGKPDETTSNTPGSLALTLNNADGRFFDGNPLGPYYGNLGRNTQIRISVPEGASYLRIRDDTVSEAKTPDAAGLRITGDLDIQCDVTLDNWKRVQLLMSKSGSTGNYGWILAIQQGGFLQFLYSNDGTTRFSQQTTAAIPVPAGRRQCLRLTYVASTGTIKFYTAPAGNLATATWTQLGPTITAGGTTLFASTAAVELGNTAADPRPGMTGKYHAAQILSGIGGTQKASPDFTQATVGGGYTDTQGNVWTPQGTAVVTNRHYRFWGETSAFPTSWNARGTSVVVGLQAAGILRRLTQSNSQQVLQSALRRAWPNLPDLVAYWPCEDGNSQGFGFQSSSIPTSFAAASPNTPIGTYQGTPQFAADTSFAASQAIPTLNSSIWNFSIPGGRSADVGNICRFLLSVPPAGEAATLVSGSSVFVSLVAMHTTGTVAKLVLGLQGGNQANANSPINTNIIVQAYNSSNTLLNSGGSGIAAVQGVPCWVSLEMYQSGGNVQIAYGVQVIGQPIAYYNGFTVAGTLGQGTDIIVNFSGTLQQTGVGHITYQRQFHDMSLGEYSSQISAWQGEAAGSRFSRLCSEQGIPFQSRGDITDTTLMGIQSQIDVMSLLQECVDADRGEWWEPPWTLALGYRTLADMLNQAPIAAIPYAASKVADTLVSNEDDQFTINDALVVNTYTGGQAEVAVTTGPLSTQAPPNGVGDYQAQPQVNLANDNQCADSAGWITWVGTAPDLRFPAVPVHMSRLDAATFFAIQEADVGDRIQIVTPAANGAAPANTAPPVWLAPSSQTSYARGGVDVLANNIATTLNVKQYDIAITGVPATPYLAAQADDPVHGRAGAANSALDVGVSAGATALPVNSPASDPWTTAGGDFPFDVGIGGEQITVTAITGPGQTNVGSDSANPGAVSITPKVTGSLIYGAQHNPTNSTVFTANGNTTYSENFSDATNGRVYAALRSTSTVTGGTPVSIGSTAPAVTGYIATTEILAAGGSITEDASSPAAVQATGAKTVTTAGFTPPGGSYLVAMVAANGTGGVTQVISGGGLTWTLLAQDALNRVTVWGARVPAAGLGAITVTITASGANSANGIGMMVKVLDNAASPFSQVMTVTRARNGISKPQAGGAKVDLYTTPVASL